MDILKKIPEIEKKIEKIIAEKREQLTSLRNQIEDANNRIDTAQKKKALAKDQQDLTAYKAISVELDDLEKEKELYVAGLQKAEAGPLVSAAQYNTMVSEIFAEIAALDDQAKQEILELADCQYAIALELQEAINRANPILRKLQHDVYRCYDNPIDKRTGNHLTDPYYDKQVDKWDTVRWGKMASEADQYEKYTGQKKKK